MNSWNGIGPAARESRRAGFRQRRHGCVPALRSAQEHLHQVIVQAIVEIALQGPGELRVIDVARMDAARNTCAVPGRDSSARSPARSSRSARARRSPSARARSGASSACTFLRAAVSPRTYASVKSNSMSLPDTDPRQTQLGSGRMHFASRRWWCSEMPMRELVEHMLGVTGKDEARVRELLLRGTLVSGASRFRWTGMGRRRRRALRTCWRPFPIPIRRVRSRPSGACAPFCAAGGSPSRSRARPACASRSCAAEHVLEAADGSGVQAGDAAVSDVLLQGPRRHLPGSSGFHGGPASAGRCGADHVHGPARSCPAGGIHLDGAIRGALKWRTHSACRVGTPADARSGQTSKFVGRTPRSARDALVPPRPRTEPAGKPASL